MKFYKKLICRGDVKEHRLFEKNFLVHNFLFSRKAWVGDGEGGNLNVLLGSVV
jgi:hypothetical protein